VTEAVSWIHASTVRAVRTSRKESKLSCSFCQVDLDHNAGPTLAGNHGEGSFCSAHCRNCVLALAALHPSVLAPDEFLSRRGVLTDQLLDLWRDGRGPDPRLVLQAAEYASRGMDAPRTAAERRAVMAQSLEARDPAETVSHTVAHRTYEGGLEALSVAEWEDEGGTSH
jgi:hypothetical protein